MTPPKLGEAVAGHASGIVTVYRCPACGQRLKHGKDKLAISEPFFLQCRNLNCAFDGSCGSSFAEAAERCGAVSPQ